MFDAWVGQLVDYPAADLSVDYTGNGSATRKYSSAVCLTRFSAPMAVFKISSAL
jgi:hypothetical protein